MDFDPTAYQFTQALQNWLAVCGTAAALLAAVSLFYCLVARGTSGFKIWLDELFGILTDVFSISPRRVAALAQLTFREAVRRKALYVFVVFGILIMFAGWFFSASTLAPEFQVKVYVTFVLRVISWLLLLVVLLMSCWGLPEDIKQRSLHTVVTKPARRLEVVLGRMAGFATVGTLVLVAMSLVGWGWIRRQLPEEAEKQLVCRQPVFGDLRFIDREGNPAATGINVGDINEFFSYIEGATKARAIWTFNGIDENVLDSEGNLRLENRFQAFRSHKGDMQRTLYFQYVLVNPQTGLRVPTALKTVNEFRGRTDLLPRTLPRVGDAIAELDGDQPEGGQGNKATYDLIDDLVSKEAVIDEKTKAVLVPAGSLQVEVSCVDPGQYIGMARPKLFIRMPDRAFEIGYLKAVVGIEMMMLLIIVMGVTASTFVKGPVATLLTACLLFIGQGAHEFMERLVTDKEKGGGAFESIYRLLYHMNPVTDLPEGASMTALQAMDKPLIGILWLFYHIIPDFSFFSRSLRSLSDGFDVNFSTEVLPGIVMMLGYLIPCVLLGCICLRNRELEAK